MTLQKLLLTTTTMNEPAPLSARRSGRERKQPKTIYEVYDRRPSVGDAVSENGAAGDDDDVITSESESTGEEEEEADERQFVSPKPKPKPRVRPTGTPRPRPVKRKPSALVRPRKLKPVQEEGAAHRKDSDATDSSDSGNAMFFGGCCFMCHFVLL